MSTAITAKPHRVRYRVPRPGPQPISPMCSTGPKKSLDKAAKRPGLPLLDPFLVLGGQELERMGVVMVRSPRLQSGRFAHPSHIALVHLLYPRAVRSIASSVPSAARFQEKPRAVARLRLACARYPAGSLIRDSIASARARQSSGGTASAPAPAISTLLGVRATTTGTPLAIASTSGKPKDSHSDGNTNASRPS